MHDRERVPMLLVTALGVVTVGLVYALAFALYPARPVTALLLGTGVCAPFGVIIAAGLYNWRVRRLLPPAESAAPAGAADHVTIDLSETSRAWIASRRRAPWVTGAVAAGLSLWLALSVVWWMGAAVAAVCAATIALLTAFERPARQLVEGAGPRPLRADAAGITLPLECLGGGIVERAVARGEATVHVGWAEVTGWERFPHQHVVHVAPDHGRYGSFPRFAIHRTPELLAREEVLLAVALAHLRVGIEVRHDP
jgi:hypothetical protein